MRQMRQPEPSLVSRFVILLFCYFHAKFIDEIGIRVYNISLYFVFKKQFIFK